MCRRALRPFGGQWEPFAEKSGTNAGGYGVLITEGGMCIKIIFEQASIELKVIICGAAYPVLVGIWQHAAVCYTIMMTRVWVVRQWWAAADQRINFIQ